MDETGYANVQNYLKLSGSYSYLVFIHTKTIKLFKLKVQKIINIFSD